MCGLRIPLQVPAGILMVAEAGCGRRALDTSGSLANHGATCLIRRAFGTTTTDSAGDGTPATALRGGMAEAGAPTLVHRQRGISHRIVRVAAQ
jgi:hypothetical protein